MSTNESLMRSAARALERVNEESSGSGSESPNNNSEERIRPLEDPYLVGEEAAARARRERLARENGDNVLYNEDRRWDWLLCKFHSPSQPFLAFAQFSLFVVTTTKKNH